VGSRTDAIGLGRGVACGWSGNGRQRGATANMPEARALAERGSRGAIIVGLGRLQARSQLVIPGGEML
jgi:hypothetical protein